MSTEQTQPQSAGDRNLARLLALLDGDQAGAMTIAALREHGVGAPAQAVYTLQLAGYPIDRISCTDADGHRTLGYRLHRTSRPIPDRSAGPRDVARDHA